MSTIGELNALGALIKPSNWDQYIVIARGLTVIHIINGELMAALIDDEPGSSDNWMGKFRIELEAVAKVSVRNIWMR